MALDVEQNILNLVGAVAALTQKIDSLTLAVEKKSDTERGWWQFWMGSLISSGFVSFVISFWRSK